MDAIFLGQPFVESASVGATLTEWLAAADTFTVCVAWSQTSGLDHLSGCVADLRQRGGEAVAIIGIDGGIATPTGLANTLATFSEVFAFHDVGSRTFHPKVYLVARGQERLVIVGSNNLTEGGLYTNYEASVAMTLRVGHPADDALISQVDTYLDNLKGDGMPIRLLQQELIDELARRPGMLTTEADRRRRVKVQRAQATAGARTLFGDSPGGLTRAPRIRRGRVGGSPAAPPPRPRPAVVEASWSKPLTISDAMRKTIGNQRAYVILGRARHVIDQKTYFRREFFAGVTWTKQSMHTGNVKEIADVPFEVVIEEQVLGNFPIRVDHAENRIANQDNAPTWLHWSSLIDVVRRSDLTGYMLTLERLNGPAFRLRLTS